MTLRQRAGMAVCFSVLCSSGPASLANDPTEVRGEVLDLRPENPAPWGLRHLFAPLVSIIRGSDYMYSPTRHIAEFPSRKLTDCSVLYSRELANGV